MSSIFDVLTQKYPFISLVTYGDNEYVGIIQNSDSVVTSFYDYSKLKTKEEKQKFLTLAGDWWFETNRQVPIQIYLKSEWQPFKYVLLTFISKDVQVIVGPNTSLANLGRKKTKKRSITLVRKLD